MIFTRWKKFNILVFGDGTFNYNRPKIFNLLYTIRNILIKINNNRICL